MADIFVRSSDGNNADDGSTWALAKATLVGAAGIDAAGDTIYLSDNHAESSASAQSAALAGTLASPVRVLCVDDTGDPSPPTALATTATVSTTAGNSITVNGCAYLYGITFAPGSGGSTANFSAAQTDGDYQFYEACKFTLGGTGTGGRINVGSSSSTTETRVHWKSCDVKFAATAHGIVPGQCKFTWEGGSLLSGGTTPTSLILPAQDQIDCDISGVDFSNAGTSMNLVGTSAAAVGRIVFRNCRLPTSWAGSVGDPTTANVRVEMWNCDSADTNYRMTIVDLFGSITQETTIVRTGGASDGDAGLSWKMVSSATAEYPMMVLRSPEILVRNGTTGSSKTLTIEIVHDSTTDLNDDEIWVEVMHLGTSGVPLGTWVSDAKADVMASAAAQASSTVTWTTTGITNVRKQKLAVTFTPQEKGYVHARVCLAKASYTVYVCPKAEIS